MAVAQLWVLAGGVLVFAGILPWISVPGGAVVFLGGLAGWVVGILLFGFVINALSSDAGDSKRTNNRVNQPDTEKRSPQRRPGILVQLLKPAATAFVVVAKPFGVVAKAFVVVAKALVLVYVALLGLSAVVLGLGLLVGVAAFLIFVAYPAVPQELGGIRPRCAHLEVATSQMGGEALKAFFPKRNPGTLTEIARTPEIDILYSRGDLLMVRPRPVARTTDEIMATGKMATTYPVYEVRGNVIRAIVGCG